MQEFCQFLDLVENEHPNVRLVSDNPSFDITWMSIKTGDFDSKHGHIKQLGFTSRWEHDNKALNDARRTVDFFNQARKEMRNFVEKTSRVVEVVPHNPEWSSMFDSEAIILSKVLSDE